MAYLVRPFTYGFYPRIFLTWLMFFYRNRPTFLFRDWNHHVLASPPYQQWVHFVFFDFFWCFSCWFSDIFLGLWWRHHPDLPIKTQSFGAADLRRTVATFAFEVARATWAARTTNWELGGDRQSRKRIWMWRNHELLEQIPGWLVIEHKFK